MKSRNLAVRQVKQPEIEQFRTYLLELTSPVKVAYKIFRMREGQNRKGRTTKSKWAKSGS